MAEFLIKTRTGRRTQSKKGRLRKYHTSAVTRVKAGGRIDVWVMRPNELRKLADAIQDELDRLEAEQLNN